MNQDKILLGIVTVLAGIIALFNIKSLIGMAIGVGIALIIIGLTGE